MSLQQEQTECTWDDFIIQIFSQPPKPPFTYTVSLLDQTDTQQVNVLLGLFLMKGAQLRYYKEIAHLLPEEIDEVKQYYQALGMM